MRALPAAKPDARRYFEIIQAMRDCPHDRTVAMVAFGGTVVDGTDLIKFWDSLPMISEGLHRKLTLAWLATCVIRGDSALERDRLRAFIAQAAPLMAEHEANHKEM